MYTWRRRKQERVVTDIVIVVCVVVVVVAAVVVGVILRPATVHSLAAAAGAGVCLWRKKIVPQLKRFCLIGLFIIKSSSRLLSIYFLFLFLRFFCAAHVRQLEREP